MKTIKNVLPESVRYSDIKMTIAILMVKTGFVRPTKSSTENLISPAHSSTNTVSIIYEGLRTRVAQPTNAELVPPNMGILLKCIAEAAEHLRMSNF